MQVLPSLTHENLKELGVASFGHRVKLLDAIAALRNETSDKAPSVDAASTLSTPSAHPEDRLGYDSIVTHCCLVKLGGRGERRRRSETRRRSALASRVFSMPLTTESIKLRPSS